MSDNKTKPTNVSVEEFLATIDEKRQTEARTIMAMMQKISGAHATMWGPSIIGYGSQHYKSEAGREGDMPILGFSPRKAKLSIYFYEGFDRYGKELEKLGKHSNGMGCLYINKLSDVDQTVLQQMLQRSFELTTETPPAEQTVEGYVGTIPAAARPQFDALREIVRTTLPDANEVYSYGIVGYKIDEKRARVFISGWNNHLGMYPVPHDETLRTRLAPYIKGKGTLWFPLDGPLPKKLIVDTVKALTRQ